MADNDKTPEQLEMEKRLREELAKYNAALESEWKLQDEAKEAASAEGVVQDHFKKHIPLAAANIVYLAQFSTSDSVKLSASKAIIEMGLKAEAKSGDPIKDLLDQLKKNPGKRLKEPTE